MFPMITITRIEHKYTTRCGDTGQENRRVRITLTMRTNKWERDKKRYRKRSAVRDKSFSNLPVNTGAFN